MFQKEESSSLNLFFASSMCELASALVVRRFLGDQPARLVFELSNSHESGATQKAATALAERFDLGTPLFLAPNFCPVRGDLSHGPARRLVDELRRGWNVPAELRERLASLIGAETVAKSGMGVAVFFSYLHNYVVHSMGVLPEAQRIYFPHGLDQPRRHQLQDFAFYFRQRGSVIDRVLQVAQTNHYRRSLRWVGLVLRMCGRSRIPVPFDGIDAAYTFSPVSLPVPFVRVSPDVLHSAIIEMANTMMPESGGQGPWADYVPARWCVILLPIEDGDGSNPWLLPALELLVQKIASREPVQTFVLKPHPRTSWERYVSIIKCIGSEIAGFDVRSWPQFALTLLTEIACARWKFRCAGSLASCAMAPWASNIPHYVSTSAARLFDQDEGSTSSFRYAGVAKMLEMEGMAIDLG